jgi:hypothetical protein
MIAVGGMDNIINGDIPVEQPGVCIVVVILAIEKKAAASLRVQVPKHYTKAAFGQEAGEVYGCSGFANAPFNIIDGNLFQEVKLITKL